MQKALIAIILYAFASSAAAAAGTVSNFHRLLLLNERNELMMVKIKDYDFWVTPGWYQNSEQSVRQGLDRLVSEHGLMTTAPELRGVFTLRTAGKDGLSVRNFYVARLTGGQQKLPEGIVEIKWLPLGEALELMSFDHISVLTRKVINEPDIVWGGAMERFGEDYARQARMTEDFYPLFPAR